MNGESSNLAERIKRHRRNLGESQEQFGARFGVRRLTVASWETGTLPNSTHLPKLTQQLNNEEDAQGEGVTYQLQLPFAQPINLEVKVSPQKADTIHFEVQFKRKAS